MAGFSLPRHKHGPWDWNPSWSEMPWLASKATFLAPLWIPSRRTFDYASRVLSEDTGALTPAWIATPHGLAADFAINTDNRITWPQTAAHLMDSDVHYTMWVAAIWKDPATTSLRQIMSHYNTNGDGLLRLYAQGISTTNQLRVQFKGSGSGFLTPLSSNGGWLGTGYHSYGFVRADGGNDWRLYADGELVDTGVNTTTPSLSGNSQKLSLHGNANNFDAGPGGTYLCAAVFKNYALTTADFEQLHYNPFGLFTRRKRYFISAVVPPIVAPTTPGSRRATVPFDNRGIVVPYNDRTVVVP